MAIFNLYIFERNGTCVFYREWKRDHPTEMAHEDECKLMYGMLLSLKSFVTKLSPKDNRQVFRSYQTSAYTLNYFETATGLKFVLNTDKYAVGVQELLRQIYSQVYVECVVKNPLAQPKAEISSDLFRERLDELVQRHSSFQ